VNGYEQPSGDRARAAQLTQTAVNGTIFNWWNGCLFEPCGCAGGQDRAAFWLGRGRGPRSGRGNLYGETNTKTKEGESRQETGQ